MNKVIPLLLASLAFGTVTGCGGSNSELEAKVAALDKRVRTLESRVGAGKGATAKPGASTKSKAGAKGKPPANRAGAKPPANREAAKGGKAAGAAGAKGAKAGGGKGTKAEGAAKPDAEDGQRLAITVAGDAEKVVLMRQRRKYPVPGEVAEGTYTVLASFGEDAPTEAGSVEVKAGGSTTLTCTSAQHSCSL